MFRKAIQTILLLICLLHIPIILLAVIAGAGADGVVNGTISLILFGMFYIAAANEMRLDEIRRTRHSRDEQSQP